MTRIAALAASLALVACGGSDDGITDTATPLACDPGALSAVKLVDAKVVAASGVAADSFTPPGSTRAITPLAAFCRVQAQATPTSDSLINFELWVPSSGWNSGYADIAKRGL